MGGNVTDGQSFTSGQDGLSITRFILAQNKIKQKQKHWISGTEDQWSLRDKIKIP